MDNNNFYPHLTLYTKRNSISPDTYKGPTDKTLLIIVSRQGSKLNPPWDTTIIYQEG